MHLEHNQVSTGLKIVNLFANNFFSIRSNEPVTLLNKVSFNFSISSSFGPVQFTLAEVLGEILSLDDSLSAGPDGLPVFFVKELGQILADPLFTLYKESISLGYFPSEWGKSFITPVHKRGPGENITNHKRVAKVSIFSKISDRLMASKLSSYFTNIRNNR